MLRESVTRLLRRSDFRLRALQLGEGLRAAGGIRAALDGIDGLRRSREPATHGSGSERTAGGE
ncbi:hypothetical protein OMP38_12200 [Cohnella ginsengisoli]|uniref:Uncharacterized protein n=1 Tax=Cohnella ginsengisoli TaxID=425004 RepID=A0A9X4KGI1_9BACL|nr:hypothetical protein [Cohnella ginsengisoli]MDG0791548.1 hypothetical protein [Cohnella ginsengisoli]